MPKTDFANQIKKFPFGIIQERQAKMFNPEPSSENHDRDGTKRWISRPMSREKSRIGNFAGKNGHKRQSGNGSSCASASVRKIRAASGLPDASKRVRTKMYKYRRPPTELNKARYASNATIHHAGAQSLWFAGFTHPQPTRSSWHYFCLSDRQTSGIRKALYQRLLETTPPNQQSI